MIRPEAEINSLTYSFILGFCWLMTWWTKNQPFRADYCHFAVLTCKPLRNAPVKHFREEPGCRDGVCWQGFDSIRL